MAKQQQSGGGMPTGNDTYTSPLAARNASEEMLRIWSPRHKFNTWRRIWLAIAEAQHEVTKDWSESKGRAPLVTAEQVAELRAVVERGITDEELVRASELERELRHDVMAHVHCLGEQCPKAKGIIHLGCTSQDVVCNADVLIQHRAKCILDDKLMALSDALGIQAKRYIDLPTLGFTHYQPAQPTTVGRRIIGWANEIWLAVERLFDDFGRENIKHMRGFRGATGTQASFLALFDGDHALVHRFEGHALWNLFRFEGTAVEDYEFEDWCLEVFDSNIAIHETRFEEDDVTEKLTLEEIREFNAHHEAREASLRSSDPIELFNETHLCGPVGQTYPRVLDARLLSDLAGIAAVLHKIATDIRLLSNRKEIDEPFGSSQIGSSAMPYKRNPMRCERICGLTRFVMNLVGNAYDTAATQWLERTLDDSSNRRLSLPEAFLALDGALDLMRNVADGLIVHEAMVRKNLMAELPFLATENILMEAVKAGGDRQDLHERIRVHSIEAGQRVKGDGLDNDLIERLRGDDAFSAVHHLLTEDQLLDPMKYIGRAVEQTERFVADVVEPLRERYGDEIGEGSGSEPRV